MAFTATFLNLWNAENLPFTLLAPFTQHCRLPFTDDCATFQLHTPMLLEQFLPLYFFCHCCCAIVRMALHLWAPRCYVYYFKFLMGNNVNCHWCVNLSFFCPPPFSSLSPHHGHTSTQGSIAVVYMFLHPEIWSIQVFCFLRHLKSSHQSLHLHFDKKAKETMKKVFGKYTP